MKKFLLSAVFTVTSFGLSQAQTVYNLDISGLYTKTFADIASGTNTVSTMSGTTKILLNQDYLEGIFTLTSPSSRTFRLDATSITFTDGTTSTARLETNGASNATNGRKITIACPAAGTLEVGAYTGTAGRGFAIEDASGTVLFNTESSLPVSDIEQLPIYSYTISEAKTIVINPNAAIYYGLIRFTTSSTSGVSSSTADADKTVASTKYYDITGREVTATTTGLILKKITYTDGTTSVEKSLVKK